MTAEIAIINRGAVTLATDSAVTLTVRGSDKIYNCADKLFELSDKDPIGIMVYNNLEFMGILLEVAIKQFRQGVGNVHQKSIPDAAEAFFRYLQNDLTPSAELQKQHARSILTPYLSSIRREFHEAARPEFEKFKRRTDFPGIFTKVVKKQISQLESLRVSPCFDNTSEEEISNFYLDTFTALIKEELEDHLPISVDHRALLQRICVLALIRDQYSEHVTGLVFAGFGEGDVFPSLMAYEIDGIIAGKLKRREHAKVTTDRSRITGEIIPFAQREMVDRFLYGVDPEFEDGIEGFLEVVIETTGKAIVQSLSRPTKATRSKLNTAVRSTTVNSLKVWREKILPAVKNRFMRQVQDTVFLMPKQELATLAQELINITSVKRKFSSGKESVGGPIDVAVISRIDGFVWVRRKHYFDPDLNPRYFHRKFGSVSQHLGEST